ncbi:MAG: CDP-archaeol synthase [Candidatus Aenigmarchaeota archaeon]|nr:CDP-archaeol synthase [Candidatus Aenigmarchaeota archaeon]
MVFDLFTLVEGFWFFLPAYGANGLAPLVKYLPARHRMDGGRQWRGKPLLGEGKSWEGFALGTLVAILVSLIQLAAFPSLPWSLSEQQGVTLHIAPMGPLLGLLLGLGAMGADALKSIVKRQLRLARGSPLPLVDQDDFILGSFLLAGLLVPAALSWLVLFLVITPAVHFATCFLGFRLGIKKEPW